MAKYVIEFDTEVKSLSVTRNGVAITDVQTVEIYQKMNRCCYDAPASSGDSEYGFGLTIGTNNPTEGESAYTRVTATELAPQGWVAFTIPGLSVAPTALEERVGAFLGRNR